VTESYHSYRCAEARRGQRGASIVSSKKNYGVRLNDEQETLIRDLAAALSLPEATIIRRFVPEGPWDAAFYLAARHAGEPDVMKMPAKLMADGLRRLMEQSARPPKSSTAEGIAPARILEAFRAWAKRSNR
jgi:hypothetical protein